MRRYSYSVIMCSAALLLVGCGSATPHVGSERTTGASDGVVVLEQGSRIATMESPNDVLAWGSYLLKVDVLDESEKNTSSWGPNEVQIGRDVTVRVDDVLWAHPDAITKVEHGQNLDVYTFPGYVRSGDVTEKAVEEGDLRMELGQEYVIAMADDIDPEGEQSLTLLGVLPAGADGFLFPSGEQLKYSSAETSLNAGLAEAPAVSGPRPGESLVDRLERWIEEP